MQYIIDLSVKYSNLRLSTYIEHKKKVLNRKRVLYKNFRLKRPKKFLLSRRLLLTTNYFFIVFLDKNF